MFLPTQIDQKEDGEGGEAIPTYADSAQWVNLDRGVFQRLNDYMAENN